MVKNQNIRFLVSSCLRCQIILTDIQDCPSWCLFMAAPLLFLFFNFFFSGLCGQPNGAHIESGLPGLELGTICFISKGCVSRVVTECWILGSEKTDFLLVVRERVRPCDVTEPDRSVRAVGGRDISSSVSDTTSRGRLTFSIRLWYSLRFSLLTRSAIFLFLSLRT